MFTSIELNELTQVEGFRRDFDLVRQSLVNHRLLQPILVPEGTRFRLKWFVELVLVSAPNWEETGSQLIQMAAEIAELLSQVAAETDEGMLFRAALLYELADQPAIGSALLANSRLAPVIMDFFQRSGPFGAFFQRPEQVNQALIEGVATLSLENLGFAADAESLAMFEQGFAVLPENLVSDRLYAMARDFSLQITATEVRAFQSVLRKRASRATTTFVGDDLLANLRLAKCPPELWAAQAAALHAGLLDPQFDSWGLAAPTGTGKTFLTRLVLVSYLTQHPARKALYIVPSKALVTEVARSLTDALRGLEFDVIALSAQLVDLDPREEDRFESSSVVVLTPEKADLLLRLSVELLEDVGVVIVDEAHHIEAGTRGALLELYLWRLKKMVPGCRFIFLSAVTPNIDELTRWLGNHPQSLTYEKRSTRMRAGVYRISGTGRRARGTIHYADGTSIVIFQEDAETRIKKGIVQLAAQLSAAGPVLVVAKGKRESETLAREMATHLRGLGIPAARDSEQSDLARLDARLEREMYSTVEMRSLLTNGVAYHHAGLPPRVRMSVEDAIRANLVKFVFATTTLAEGVNFPFSSVIVQSIAIREQVEAGRPVRYHAVTPRSFWNIAGRAGRPGFDKEGQAILYEPSLGAERVNAVMEPYLNPSLTSINPVTSALANGIADIKRGIEAGDFTLEDIAQTVLPERVSKRSRGALNLLRVGVVHARAVRLQVSPEEIWDGTFAARSMSQGDQVFARDVMQRQAQAINAYLETPDTPSVESLAKLGISVDTMARLLEYVRALEDWQIESFQRLFFGGEVNLEQCAFVIGPVSSRMAELEGPVLGGLYTDAIVQWIAGVPFTRIKSLSRYDERIEDLISFIYSRVQFLLPWGLYAADELIMQEAQRRGINYNNEVRQLAFLADAGVPSFDAVRLIGAGFERVDAARLAKAYRRAGGLELGVDVIGWIMAAERRRLEAIVRAPDNRRLDFDFGATVGNLQNLDAPMN